MKKIILDSNAIIQRWLNGETAQEIADTVGCSKNPILRILRDAGYSRERTRKENREKAKQIALEKQVKREDEQNRIVPKEVVAFYKEHTLKETAAHFKIGQARVREVCKQAGYEKPAFTWSSWSDETKEKAKAARQKKVLEVYGVNNALCLGAEQIAERRSKTNLWWKAELEKFGLHVKMEKGLGGKQYDLLVGEKLLIEINPTITHSVTASYSELANFSNRRTLPVSKDYHHKKWQIAKENGYELISVFDWMNKEKTLALIASKAGYHEFSVGARKCEVQEVSKRDADEFFEKHHVLGVCKGQQIILGLYRAQELLSVMSFGKPRFGKDAEYELLRFANKTGYSIPGAASKLFNKFLSLYHPKSILTFSDNNLGNGGVYETLGFSISNIIKISSTWCHPVTLKFIKGTSLVFQGADRLLKPLIENYFFVGLDKEDFEKRGGKEEYSKEYEQHREDPNWWPGNQDIVRHYGFVEVCDCGAIKWIWECK